MPEDVLEQFVIDHGLNEDFQREYADLDLYSIAWELNDLSTEQIITSWSKFDNYIAEVAEILRKHANDKPHPPHMTAASWKSWLESGTWRRAPIFLDSVLARRSGLHLVEGHTRVGVLKGLLDTGLPIRLNHGCWVGRRSSEQSGSADWVSVLEEHPLSFYSWLFDGIGEKSLRGEIAERLMQSEDALRYTHAFPSSLEGLVALASTNKTSGVRAEQLILLTQEWRSELEKCAGRRLRLSA
jgi:hypothetical protein